MKGKGVAKAAAAASKGKEVGRSGEQGKSSGSEVSEFLSSTGLAVYSPLFLREGIEDLETLHELTDSHLSSLGLPIGHRLKLLKRLKDLRQSCSSVPVPEPVPTPIAETVAAVPETGKRTKPEGREERAKGQSTYEMYRVAIEEFRRTGMEEKESRWGKAKEAKPIPSPVQPQQKSPPLLPVSKPIESKRPSPTETCSYCHQPFPKGQAQKKEGKVYCSPVCLEEVHKAEAEAEMEVRNRSEYNEEAGEPRPQSESEDSGEVEATSTENGEAASIEQGAVSHSHSGQSIPSLKSVPPPVPSRIPFRLKKKPAVPPKLPSPSSDPSLLESSEQVRGWDAPVEASFDLGRNEE